MTDPWMELIRKAEEFEMKLGRNVTRRLGQKILWSYFGATVLAWLMIVGLSLGLYGAFLSWAPWNSPGAAFLAACLSLLVMALLVVVVIQFKNRPKPSPSPYWEGLSLIALAATLAVPLVTEALKQKKGEHYQS